MDGRAWGRKWAALPWGVECRLLAIGGASFAVSPVRALSWVRAAHALCLVCLVASFDGLRGGWWARVGVFDFAATRVFAGVLRCCVGCRATAGFAFALGVVALACGEGRGAAARGFVVGCSWWGGEEAANERLVSVVPNKAVTTTTISR